MAKIVIADDRQGVICELVKLIESTSNEQIQKHDIFNIGVSGGSLADFLTVGLPKINTNFSKWRIFFCDERVVPEDDPDSTFGLYKRKLIDSSAVDLKADQFVVIEQGVTTEDAAVDYENKLKEYFPGEAIPSFDMLLLGMGPDGHTCSLFPEHKLLSETSRWVAPIIDSPKPPPSRVTLTYPVINNAKVCIFAISGKDKAEMVKRVLKCKEDLPSSRVKPVSGQLVWILDNDAALYVNE